MEQKSKPVAVSFLVMCKNRIGLKDGQKLTDLSAEGKLLTPQDKLDMCAWAEAEGEVIKEEDKERFRAELAAQLVTA